MAKKSNKKQQNKVLKPEDYIRTKVRKLPVYKCYKSVNQFEDREMSIIVVRQHPQGTFTYGAYMLDRWCLGVKDTLWQFSKDKDDLEEFLSLFRNHLHSLEEIPYVEAHNWIYGASDFAEEAGISPCKEFALSKYILEEDDDDVELIEYDFGRDGEYCLVAKDKLEASRYIPTLDKNLGEGNYTVEIGMFGDDDWDDDQEDYDDWEDDEEEDYRLPFKPVPSMEYTYKGKDYPKEITLHYPEIEAIAKKNTEKITESEIKQVLSLPSDMAREDLHNLVLREIGIQWGKTANELSEDESCNWNVVGNAFMFLTKFGTVEETLPIVLETMRQNEGFLDYNFCDVCNILLHPVLCTLVKDNPRLLKPYLLEPGLYYFFKIVTFELLEQIAKHCPEVKKEIVEMTVEVLKEYKKDLPTRTICDGTVAAFAIGVLVGNGASEYLPLIEDLYATGLIDEECEGHIEEVRSRIQRPSSIYDLPPMDPYGVLKEYKKIIGSL